MEGTIVAGRDACNLASRLSSRDWPRLEQPLNRWEGVTPAKELRLQRMRYGR